MATAFAPAVFGSPVFSQQAFGNGPCPGPGPCGPPGGEEPAEREPGGRQFYDQEKIKQRRLHEQIMREDHEIEEFLRTLLSKGIL